ncbi:MAG TPA: hypothetical protein DEH78_06960 [Solibacterales bacterium]|nr:hypothetical protein [Bryobacterales bacterium]
MADPHSAGIAEEPAPNRDPGGPLRAHLEEILASRVLERADQLRRLLIYLVEAEADGKREHQTESAIGVNVFRRRDFDPKADTIVRTQVSRLRRKLEQYYLEEGAQSPQMIVLEKHGYRLKLQARAPGEAVPAVPPGIRGDSREWKAWAHFAMGAAAALCATMLAAWVLWPVPGSLTNASPPELVAAKHPVWAPLLGQGGPLKVAISTPLFFRSGSTEVRDHRLNRVEDLALASKVLKLEGLTPAWDRWVSASEMEAIASVVPLLVSTRSSYDIINGRQFSDTPDVAHMRVLAIGHPRGMPALARILAEERFAVDVPQAGVIWSGIIDRRPAPGEPRYFAPPQASIVPSMDEILPDYALLTARQAKPDGYFLSLFGNRTQTSAFLAKALTDPAWLQTNLPAASLNGGFRSVQYLFRVNYKSGRPNNANRIAEHVVR